MSHCFPEQPLFLYPSLAKQYGVEEAILLGIYHQFSKHYGHVDAGHGWYFIARRSEWLAMAEFWDDEKLALVTNSLVAQGAIDAEFNTNGSIRIGLALNEMGSNVNQAPASALSTPGVGSDAGVDAGAVLKTTGAVLTGERAADTDVDRKPSLQPRGPAPSFGGSTGWSRRQDDELEALFKEQEKQHQLLHEITPEWRPTETTLQLLAKHTIPTEFIEGLRDGFIVYWLAQGQKKKSWDPQFIDHVKRQWVREQSRQGRDSRQATDLNTEASGERYQSTSRAEKRERISKAVMDIKNIDW